MAVSLSRLIAQLGVRVDPAEVEEALRELPPSASVMAWYSQMTAQEQTRRNVVASVLMELQARALPGDPWCENGSSSSLPRRSAGVEPIGLGGAGVAGVASVGPTLCH